MENFESSLILQHMVFDKIEFQRKGFKNNNDLKMGFQIQIGIDENKVYKVTLILTGEKEEEYSLCISLSGFFTIREVETIDKELADALINKNAVAILMPYIRSELSLLTAQPDTESVVLPPFNIAKMLGK